MDINEIIDPKTSLPNLKTLSHEVDLLAFCLMPNHFHLLVRQQKSDGIQKLLERVCTNYVMYFNKRYDRVGPLFEGIYKGVLVETDEQLMYVSAYIHRNPRDLSHSGDFARFTNYRYSSYGFYIGSMRANWLKPHFILNYFKQAKETNNGDGIYKNYQAFVKAEDIMGNVANDLLLDLG